MKWFVGALLILAVALILESGLLAYAMYVLLAMLLLSRLLTMAWIGNLEITRHCNAEELEVGDTLSVRVTIKNNGAVPIPWLLLEDVLPVKNRYAERNKVRVRRKRMKITMLGSRGQTELNYQLEFRSRGYYQIGPLVAETGDFFGLHRRYQVGTEPHFVLVFPEVVPLEGYELTSKRPLGELRMTHRLYEDPTRIAGVREYQPGDPLSRVHWKATARAGTLHCKIYEPSTIIGATILLDLHESGYPNRSEPVRSEFAVTAAASLAFALFQMGEQFGLITNARDAADRLRQEGWEADFRTRQAALASVQEADLDTRLQPIVVPTRRGADQFERVWSGLARLELNDGLSFAEMVLESSSRMPRDATVIAILPQVTAAGAAALGNLRRQGYAVFAVLVMLEQGDALVAQSKLLAERIDSTSITDDPSLAAMCRKQVYR